MDVYNGTYTDTIGREQGYPKVFLQRNTDTTEAQRVVFEKAYEKGVTLLYGTDAAVLPHDMGGWQFATMIERACAPWMRYGQPPRSPPNTWGCLSMSAPSRQAEG